MIHTGMAALTLDSRKKLVFAGAAALAALVLAAAALWFFLLRDTGAFRYVIGYDPPPPVSIAAALESLAATPPSTDTAPPGDHRGAWALVPGDTSFAGYRVVETLASFGANTAVGRTTALEGSLTFDGAAITHVDITADLRALTSDQSERDENLHFQAIESDAYPEARFVLTSPIEVGALPPAGEAVTQTVRGELTLHGVTRPVELQAQGALQAGLLVVAGSTEVQFADYNIQQPSSFSVLSTEDHGTLEFQLVFSKQ
jgi:polyisoprenoid-binding protein YceI